jgi:hypothetical protein
VAESSERESIADWPAGVRCETIVLRMGSVGSWVGEMEVRKEDKACA